MLFLCVNVYCHRVTTQLQLINIIIIIIIIINSEVYFLFGLRSKKCINYIASFEVFAVVLG